MDDDHIAAELAHVDQVAAALRDSEGEIREARGEAIEAIASMVRIYRDAGMEPPQIIGGLAGLCYAVVERIVNDG